MSAVSQGTLTPIDLTRQTHLWSTAFWLGLHYRSYHLFVRREKPSRSWIGGWAVSGGAAFEWTASPRAMRHFHAALSPATNEKLALHLTAYEEIRSLRGTRLEHEDGEIYYFAGPTLDALWDWMAKVHVRLCADIDAAMLRDATVAGGTKTVALRL